MTAAVTANGVRLSAKKNPCPDDSEIMWQVIAKVAQMVKARYPGKYIGTLVYPPKQRIPKTVKLPGNIRVVICLQGPKKINDPKSMKHQLGTLRAWNKVVGKGNVGLWSYQCELHGGKLPGVPEYYPEYFQRYLKQILPYTNSIYHEHHAHNLTYRLLETYLHFKIFWDPDADVKKLKAEHIRLYYGPAAPFMAKVIARMEENWRRYERGSKNVPDPSSQIGIYRNFSSLKKFVWGKIYDKKEMAYLESLLKSAQKAAGKSIYGERVERFHRLVFKFMERERLEVMDLSDLAPRITITSAPWEKQKSYQLISAHRDGTKLDSSLRCMFRLHKGFLQVRVIADEPRIADIRVTPRLKNGSPMIWKDWALEFFLYVPSDKAIRQYIVNAANVLSRTTTSAMKRYWSNGAEAKSVITRKNDQIIWDLSIPLSELGKDLKGLKLNVAHERNLKKGSTGYATFSPAALLGNWHNTDAYAQVTLKK